MEGVSWMTQRSDCAWVVLRPSDSIRLESCYRLCQDSNATEETKRKYKYADIDFGRRVVDIEARTVSTRYWQSEPCNVRRCLWFYDVHGAFMGNVKKVAGKQVSMPYTEDISAAIESFYQCTKASPDAVKRFTLPDGKRQLVYHTKDDGMGRSGMWQYTLPDLKRENGCRVRRGLGEPVVERDDVLDEFAPVRHLVIVVHGIGEHWWSSGGEQNEGSQESKAIRTAYEYDMSCSHIVSSVDQLRHRSDALVRTSCQDKETGGLIPPGRVEYLPIEWASAIRSPAVQNKLNSITLPGIKSLRSLANNVALDILFYMNPETRKIIMRRVKEGIECTASLFLKHNPNFKASGGKISLMGHSLGSVILWDMLSHETPPFSFAPESLMLFGSPVGVFEMIRKQALSVDYKLPSVRRVYNVFHPHDAIAYRIEPCCLKSSLNILQRLCH